MGGVRVDIRVPVGRPIPEVVEFIHWCEAVGLHGVGIHDHHHSGRDAYVSLALAAARTQQISLYPVTSNTVTRHPLVLAALANSLHEVAPGRVSLTLAPGYLSVEFAGRRRASLKKLRDDVIVIRRLLQGQEASSDKVPMRLRNWPRSPLPVLLTASGPRLLELAGEVADGVLMLVGLDPRSITAARGHLRAGAERAGRDPKELQEIFIVPIAIGERSEVRNWPRRQFREGQHWLEYPSRSNLYWLRKACINLPEDMEPSGISDALADQICDAFGLFGEPECCAERLIRAYEESGVRHVFLFPAHTFDSGYEMPRKEIEAFDRVIGPRLPGR